jgi:sulfoxide reductase heme-binding subunit YedZ
MRPVLMALQAPWRDRRGRFSVLKAVTFALLLMPGVWLAWLTATGGLTPRPFGFLIYNTGAWAMWFLLISLAVTPARHILNWRELITVRRMIGLAGFAYTLLHVVIYFALDRNTWAFFVRDLERPTILIAIASTLGLLALAVTSFDAAVRRLGSRTWNWIHNLTYPAIGLAAVHFDMGPESVGGTPFVVTGLFFWLMGWRGLHRLGLGSEPLALLGLTLASASASFLFETVWLRGFRGFSGVGPAEELWQIGLGLAATWQVMLVGLAGTALCAIFSARHTRARLGLRMTVPRRLQPT